MSQKSDPVVPIRLDGAEALKMFQKLGQQAGIAVGQGKKYAQDQTRHFAKQMEGLIEVPKVVEGARDVPSAIDEQMNRAADYTRDVAREFIELRRAMQQVTVLTDEQDSDPIGPEPVGAAATVGLTPEPLKSFRQEFQRNAGAPLKDLGAKRGAEQAEKYQHAIAELVEARGIEPARGAELASSLLESSKSQQNSGNLLDRYSKVFQTLEKGRSPVKQLLPQLSRQIADGVSADEAADLMARIAPSMPGEASAGVEYALGRIENAELATKGPRFGVKEGTSLFEELKAVAENRRQRRMRSGDMGTILEDIAPDHYERPEVGIKLEELRRQARTELTRQGRFGQAPLQDVGRPILGNLTGATFGEQSTNEPALKMGRELDGLRPGQTVPVDVRGRVSGLGQDSYKVLDESLRRLVEFEERKARDRQAAPLIAAPPNPGGRMGGG